MAGKNSKNINETEELINDENLGKMMEELKEEAHQEPNTIEETIETIDSEQAVETSNTVIKPAKDTVQKFKLYFVSDMDEEAEYLHEMSLKGYHFLKKEGIRYTFKQAEAKNYYYHLGYYEKDKRDGERYLENYKAAGWDSIYHEKAEFDGVWHYFRTEAMEGEEPHIFSDKESRISLYKRLLSSWRSLIAMIIIFLIFVGFLFFYLTTHPNYLQSIAITLCVLVSITLIVALGVYLKIYLKINKKLAEFKYQ